MKKVFKDLLTKAHETKDINAFIEGIGSIKVTPVRITYNASGKASAASVVRATKVLDCTTAVMKLNTTLPITSEKLESVSEPFGVISVSKPLKSSIIGSQDYIFLFVTITKVGEKETFLFTDD